MGFHHQQTLIQHGDGDGTQKTRIAVGLGAAEDGHTAQNRCQHDVGAHAGADRSATFAVRMVWYTPARPTPTPANRNEMYWVFLALMPVWMAHFSLPPMKRSLRPMAVL